MVLLDKILNRNKENNQSKQNNNNEYNSRVHKIKRQYIGDDGNIHYDQIQLIYEGVEGLVMETGGIKQVPVYRLTAPEIDNGQNLSGVKIYAEIDEERLGDENDNYKEWVVQILFSKDRTQKIFSRYNGYAGGLNIDSNGDLYMDEFGNKKYVDPEIIKALEYKKELEWSKVSKKISEIREGLQPQKESKEYEL